MAKKKEMNKMEQLEEIEVASSEIVNKTPLENGQEEQNQEVAVDKKQIDELGLSQEYVDEKLNEAMKTMAPKKRKKSIIISLVFLLINIVFMATIISGLLANLEENNNIFAVIESRGDNLWWLAGGVVIYAIYIFVQVLMYYELIKSLTGKKRMGLAYDVAILGKYYDNVTPFAVGGQPMQIVRLSKNDISAGVSTSIPIIKMIMNTFVNMIIALLFFVFGLPYIPMVNELNGLLLIIFEILGIIGLVVTVIVSLFMFMLSTGNFVTRSFISGVLRLGYKLKIVKNYRQTLKKTINQVSEYRSSMKYLLKNKKLFFKMIILCIFECLTYASMTYFVIRAFASGAETTTFIFFIVCIVKYYICSMASSYIPLPGGTGMMEISFIFLFGIVVNDYIVWALLAYRIISYYLLLAHGFVHEMVHIGKNFIKNKREKRSLN